MGVTIPIAVSAFPDELYQAPRSWVERAYPKLIHYNKLDKGGHFAAWEQPKLLTEELRAGFRVAAQLKECQRPADVVRGLLVAARRHGARASEELLAFRTFMASIFPAEMD